MIIPNKIVTLEQSILGKSRYILDVLSGEPINVHSLFNSLKDHFDDVNEFVLALDVLFSLNYIGLTKANEVFKNA